MFSLGSQSHITKTRHLFFFSFITRRRPTLNSSSSLPLSFSISLTISKLADEGCWFVVMDQPEGNPSRDEIIKSYIKTSTMVVGSEEEAKKMIYFVSTRCYFAFGAKVSEGLTYKIKELLRVHWVVVDDYLDVENKDFGCEPFIDRKAAPYDPKYHEEWIRNKNLANGILERDHFESKFNKAH